MTEPQPARARAGLDQPREARSMGVSQPTTIPGRREQTRDAALRTLSTVGILPFPMIAMIVYFGIREPRFVEPANIFNVSRQATYLSIVTLGQALVLISGGFDLSVGALIAATSVVRWLRVMSPRAPPARLPHARHRTASRRRRRRSAAGR